MDRKIKDILFALIPFIAILLIWIIISYFSIMPNWLLPSPIKTLSTFFTLILDGTIFNLLLLSALNALPPFMLALIASVSLGILIGINRTTRKILFPFISFIYPIPSLAWLPFIILFLGFTRQAIWCVIFISVFMKMIYNIIGGVRNVNKNWILAARNFGLNKTEIAFNVIIPGALPQIMTGMRIGFGSAWRSLIGAEMLVSSLGGLGTFIWMSQWFFNFEKVIIGIFLIALIGIAIEQFIFKKIEKINLEKWGFLKEE